MKHLKKFNEGFFSKKSKEPIIEYKEENGKFFKRNPSGGDWVEISESEFNKNSKVNEEYTNSDYRKDMTYLSDQIKKDNVHHFYVMDQDGFIGKYKITDKMRNGFEAFYDGDHNIKDVGEFMMAFADSVEGTLLFEPDITNIKFSLKGEMELETEFLEDYPEFLDDND